MALDDRGIPGYPDGDPSPELPTPDQLVAPRTGLQTGDSVLTWSLTACSRCLRVLRDGEWVLAELVIRELRSFEYGQAPRFEHMLCPTCTGSIDQRRGARLSLERDLVRSSGRG